MAMAEVQRKKKMCLCFIEFAAIPKTKQVTWPNLETVQWVLPKDMDTGRHEKLGPLVHCIHLSCWQGLKLQLQIIKNNSVYMISQKLGESTEGAPNKYLIND